MPNNHHEIPVHVMILNFVKAFDTMSHAHVIAKVVKRGFTDIALSSLQKYLRTGCLIPT